MREYGLPLTPILPYKDRILDPVFSHILCSEYNAVLLHQWMVIQDINAEVSSSFFL